jgi:hypothetical protein
MKRIQRVVVLGVLATISLELIPAHAADTTEGLAVAIVYDTSGSMKDSVRDGTGRRSPKYAIANRALEKIALRLEAYATNTAAGPRDVRAGLFVFDGKGAKEAVAFGPFHRAEFQNWTREFSQPDGGTPLGGALTVAARRVLDCPLSHKHVLLITDGENTIGPEPAPCLVTLQRQAEKRGELLSVHFVAFDVDGAVFGPVKKLGATVVSAADESQLNQQLEFILEKKILLEAEEPKKN